MDKTAVIVGGGTGTRMGMDIPKQFVELNGKPVIAHTIDAFYTAFPDISIILVLPEKFLENGKDIMNTYFKGKTIQIVTGGFTRFDSVKNGLSLVKTPSIVFVHDAVRCLVSNSIIHRCYDAAVEFGSAIPVVAVKDSIRRILSGANGLNAESEVVKRDELRAVQTPQSFQSQIILTAFQTHFQEAFTDEATVVEQSGIAVHLVEGEEENIKITYPADLDYARQVLSGKTISS